VERLESCNLCEGRSFELFARKRGVQTEHLFELVRCRGCGLHFVNPRLSENENLSLYGEAYFHGNGFDVSINYVQEGEDVRRGENEGIIAKIQTLRPGPRLRVLDVGCGTGSLLGALQKAGYDAWGVEFSEYAASQAQVKTCARVVVGDVLHADFGGETFDVVNATEVIEHLRDPLAFFRRVRSLLRPQGLFLYNTGNIAGAYARALGSRWPYLHPEGHLFYYSPSTLEQYLRRAGLDVLYPTHLDGERRAAFVRAEARIAHSQVRSLGASDRRRVSGWLFRLVGAVPASLAGGPIARALGRLAMPLGVKPGDDPRPLV
jgi:2-polyprenyl-3-methyl-5-hydroxy-6-metoxy-1,4-benzoquinol methylase